MSHRCGTQTQGLLRRRSVVGEMFVGIANPYAQLHVGQHLVHAIRGRAILESIDHHNDRGKPFQCHFDSDDRHRYNAEQIIAKFKIDTTQLSKPAQTAAHGRRGSMFGRRGSLFALFGRQGPPHDTTAGTTRTAAAAPTFEGPDSFNKCSTESCHSFCRRSSCSRQGESRNQSACSDYIQRNG